MNAKQKEFCIAELDEIKNHFSNILDVFEQERAYGELRENRDARKYQLTGLIRHCEYLRTYLKAAGTED